MGRLQYFDEILLNAYMSYRPELRITSAMKKWDELGPLEVKRLID